MTRRSREIARKQSSGIRPLVARTRADYWPEHLGSRITPMPNGCWAFDGELDRYHEVGTTLTATQRQAHRVVYEALGHHIPRGHHLHHECRNPGCVNPAHLRPLTPAEHAEIHNTLG